MPFPASTVLGYPRIGPRRELKRALEAYWDGRATRADLDRVGRDLRARAWRTLAGRGLDGLPSNTFSEYDHVLDTAVLLGAVPDRYRDRTDPHFAMARGAAGLPPLRMTKWFNTNYHYIVPELGTSFQLDATKPLAEIAEARALGFETRPVFVGPETFLALSDRPDPALLPLLLDEYAKLLGVLAADGVEWVQFDEPIFATGAGSGGAYDRLAAVAERPKILVATYFGDGPVDLPVEAIALDLVRGSLPTRSLAGQTVVAGVVSGREVWRTDRGAALAKLHALRELGATVVVGTAGSLLHVPYDLDLEPDLDAAVRDRLAFADQKVSEVVDLATAFAAGAAGGSLPTPLPDPVPAPAARRGPYEVRRKAQAGLGLPALPTTTIGSFPQTDELRLLRAGLRAGSISIADYEKRIEAEIERVVRLQERLGLDVLVHGEPERNDMVQYFAEHLDGFAVTRNGWVQSYGSRCTRPPIIHGDVRRPAPITLRWTAFAQSLTGRPVKGMLTGPVTIVAWSFVRDDLPLQSVVAQVADAVRAEVADLSAAGVPIIQVDEPALRELLPLRASAQAAYLEWAVAAYRRATSSAPDAVQIHTHLCYSDADQIVKAIDGLDADVTTIESARSGGRILRSLSFDRGLGPGVYDIHSPRVPSVAEVADSLRAVIAVVPRDRVWANPDCGLKTRTYEQVEAALANLVEAARSLRE